MKLFKITVMMLMIASAILLISCGNGKNTEEHGIMQAAEENVTGSADEGNDKNGSYDSDAAETGERSVADAPTAYISDDMYENATKFANIDLTRLEAVMRKAEEKQPITVAVIGGSITQGSSATKPENSYAAIMRKWWQRTFPDTEINYVNAGIGGTDSYLGVHRMDRDLLEYRPDFVIVEFSVNDADTTLLITSRTSSRELTLIENLSLRFSSV